MLAAELSPTREGPAAIQQNLGNAGQGYDHGRRNESQDLMPNLSWHTLDNQLDDIQDRSRVDGRGDEDFWLTRTDLINQTVFFLFLSSVSLGTFSSKKANAPRCGGLITARP